MACLLLGWALVAFSCSTTESGGGEEQPPVTTDTTPPAPVDHSNDPLSLEGIDVSHYQGDVDWTQVATEKKFAICKATGGLSETDQKFTQNWEGIKAAGLVRGAYHFYYPKDDPKKQAEHFINTVNLEAGDLAPVLDVEVAQGEDAAEIDAGVKIWLEAIEAHYGVKPIIYSDYSYLERELPEGFCDYPLWLADYATTEPKGVACWESWNMLQYSASGKVAGVNGDVDVDKYVGTTGGWEALRKE